MTVGRTRPLDRTTFVTDTAQLRRLIRVPAEARRLYPRGELFDLEPAPLQVLIALVLGAADDTSGLAQVLAMNRSTVSHSLKALTARGLIERAADPEDGRRSRLTASTEGRRLVDAFASARRAG